VNELSGSSIKFLKAHLKRLYMYVGWVAIKIQRASFKIEQGSLFMPLL
jgi:hypothetical protein